MTVSLNITTNLSLSDADRFVKSSTDPWGECEELATLFRSLNSGAISGNIVVQKSTAAAVRASGTVTLVYADLAANDTVTIAGIVLTCVTGNPASFAEFKKVTDLATTAANLAASINGLTTLNVYVSASPSGGVVTVTAHQPGTVGNAITLAKNSNNANGIAVSGVRLANGAGGIAAAPVTYSRGL